jgi:hypothetical protein
MTWLTMYVKWGSQDKEFNVLVDCDEIPVTANAYNLLRDISSYLFPRLIWIDSICIDQDNISEKTEQVRLMGEIYTGASLGTVWLSTSATKQSDADEFVDNVQASLALLHIKQLNGVELTSTLSLYKTLASEKQKPLWKATLKLLDHEYFERSWIIQEIVLLSYVRVMYRSVEIDWETFTGGLLQLAQVNLISNLALQTDDENTHSASPSDKLANLGQIQAWRVKRHQGQPVSFWDVVLGPLGVRRFKATDLRDKIFAVHGICGNISGEWTVPNYSMKLSDVYLDATRRLIHEEGIPRTLYAAGVGYFSDTTPGLESLPSWVPDWSRGSRSAPLSYLSPSIDYGAGRDAQPDAHHLDGTSLLLSTHLLDTIAELAPPLDMRLSDAGERKVVNTREDWQTLVDSYQLILDSTYVQKPYQHTNPPQTVDELFWRLLIGDRTSTHRPAPPNMNDKYAAYLQVMQLAIEALEMSTEEFNQRYTGDTLTVVHKAHEYAVLAGRAWVQRRVCITKRGYVGLVPQFSIKGDAVAVIIGAQTPFVVRPVTGETKYQLVGECYIHGIMDGEALTTMTRTDVIEVV